MNYPTVSADQTNNQFVSIVRTDTCLTLVHFYPAYVDASNYGVGVFMNGCGFSLSQTITVATDFAHGESKNAGSPRQKLWWKTGWKAAQSGKPNGKPFIVPPPLRAH
jgi:hypothetical protein